MNILYNQAITEEHIKLFKLMEEFMYTYLEDKSIFYKITIHFKESEDKISGLSYIGLCDFRLNKPFEPIIKISDYAIRLSSNVFIYRGLKPFDSYEKYRYKLIFHELAHLVDIYNNLEEFSAMCKGQEELYDEETEDRVNDLSDEFLLDKNII